MLILAYVIEEVRRQGHDVARLDGIERVAWMLNAWCFALRRRTPPTIDDILHIGWLIESDKNENGFRQCDVRVGPRLCPPYERIEPALNILLEQRDALTPLEFYKEFEMIHPFKDGNGRTGKILLNWLNGTLHDPIFPPSDLFGEPITNP